MGPTVHGREFLVAADDLAGGATEAHWRTAVGRAYYALLLECRDAQHGWGLTLPAQHQIHRIVRLRFVVAGDADLLQVATLLEKLGAARAKADYRPEDLLTFAAPGVAVNHIADARKGLQLVGLVDADSARRAAALLAIRKGIRERGRCSPSY
jgi:hypothetical protein